MALITFEDSAGTTWRVWNVTRDMLGSGRADYLGAEFRTGWLCFQPEGSEERRRLASFPDDWASLSPDRLERLCLSATPVVSRRTGDFERGKVGGERPTPTAEMRRFEDRGKR